MDRGSVGHRLLKMYFTAYKIYFFCLITSDGDRSQQANAFFRRRISPRVRSLSQANHPLMAPVSAAAAQCSMGSHCTNDSSLVQCLLIAIALAY